MEDAIKKQLDNKVDFDLKRELKEHVNDSSFKAYTEVFSVLPVEFLFKVLCSSAQANFNEYTVSKDTFKIKGKAIKDEGSCSLNIEITKVDENTSCIEFQKKSGNIMVFFKIIEEIKKNLPVVESEEDKKEEKTSN